MATDALKLAVFLQLLESVVSSQRVEKLADKLTNFIREAV